MKGVGLVSIMIAMFVIMTSVLGYVAMQVRSMRAVTGSQLGTQAMTIASTIADGLRANRPAAIAGNYDGPVTSPESIPQCEGLSASCSASETAAHDMQAWRASLAALPGGKAHILRTLAADGETLLRVAVCWNGERVAASESCPPVDGETKPLKHYALEVIL